MRVVVTGGAGFIGSHIVAELMARNDDVLVLDDLSTGKLSNLADVDKNDRFDFEKLDIRDSDGVTRAFRRFQPEVVFHLAAQMDVRASMHDPAHDASVNVLGTINVLAAATATGVRKVVNTSTGGAIYGDGVATPTPETTGTHPAAAYGLSKLAAERYADWFRRYHELDVVTLRYGNVYGPRQDPSGDSGVVAIFCGLALHGARPTVFGDGLQSRDYVFVRDIVSANLTAADTSNLGHSEYNVGTGVEVTVLDLVEAVVAAAGIDPESFRPDFAPHRPGELIRSCLDISRARHDLRLGPPTRLVDGLAATLDWIRESNNVDISSSGR